MTKGVRRSTTRTPARRAAAKSSVKGLAVNAKSVRPIAKRATSAKAPVRKVKTAKVTKKALSKRPSAPARKKVTKTATPAKKAALRQSPARRTVTAPQKALAPRVKKTQKVAAVRAPRPAVVSPPPRRPPTVDESAALLAFEHAHKEFTHGHFGEARNQFRGLLEKYSQVSEVAARARTYLAIAEARLRTENMLPRDADSLYDRGVIELNRGEYVAAQEMFERALKREPEAAHIHYGLAATRARLGSLDLALQSLQRALDLQPNLRVRAQHDQDLTSLRNDPDFDKLIFQPRA